MSKVTKKEPIEVGSTFPLKQGGTCTVTEYNGWDDVVVSFNDSYGYVKKVQAGHLRKGWVANPYHPTVFGIGFIGVGEFKTKNGKRDSHEYVIWRAMMTRCYCPDYQSRFPTYKECTVDVNWHNFQNFAKWYTENKYYGLGYELDKDLLTKGNKIYSAKNCCLVPQSINTLTRITFPKIDSLPIGVTRTRFGKFSARVFMNGKNTSVGTYENINEASDAYVATKELHVKNKAQQWRDRINPSVFNALMNWTVY